MKQSWTEQMGGGCYQGARLEEANDECTEDEAEAVQGLTDCWWTVEVVWERRWVLLMY